MKQDRPYPRVIVTKKGTRWVENGHPWIYEAEALSIEQDGNAVLPENGSLVDAVSEGGKYLGTGFLSLKSKIRVRLLSQNANDVFDRAFWERRVRYAVSYRKQVMGSDFSACRLIYGEADGFPGLTVDLFQDLLVAEVLSVGMEKVKTTVFDLLFTVLSEEGVRIRGLYERNEEGIRVLEGLTQYKGWYTGGCFQAGGEPVTEITENGIRFLVDVENGQKTGFFLDQKYNRLAIRRISKGLRVLDCFTHTGSFALNAAFGGASMVTAADVSETALENAKENAARNGLSDRISFVRTDVFDFLTSLEKAGSHPYDLIILDPPAFTKSRKTARDAYRGYKEINYRAMKVLPRGGYLATASCSHFMPSSDFEEMLKSAASDAAVTLREIEVRKQAPDHPILWNVPETFYLKFYLFQIV